MSRYHTVWWTHVSVPHSLVDTCLGTTQSGGYMPRYHTVWVCANSAVSHIRIIKLLEYFYKNKNIYCLTCELWPPASLPSL
jgi:hypothetical protein